MYSDLSAALARAKQASTLNPALINDSYAVELLQLSAGKTLLDVVEYRPFIVAAALLEQDPKTQRLIETKGTKFDNLQRTIDSLYKQQYRIDQALELVIPPGFESIASDCDRCGPGTGPGGTAVMATRKTVKTILSF